MAKEQDLGLATAYGIVKMHKGQISADSNNNPAKGPTGTSFKIVSAEEEGVVVAEWGREVMGMG